MAPFRILADVHISIAYQLYCWELGDNILLQETPLTCIVSIIYVNISTSWMGRKGTLTPGSQDQAYLFVYFCRFRFIGCVVYIYRALMNVGIDRLCVTGKKAYDRGIGRTPFAFENIPCLHAPDPVYVHNGKPDFMGSKFLHVYR